MTDRDPYERTMALLLHAARSPMRYRTKGYYLKAIPRAAGSSMPSGRTRGRGGWLIIDPAAPRRRTAAQHRYVLAVR